jgi:hypothetical protein
MTLMQFANLGISPAIAARFDRRVEPRYPSLDEAIMVVASAPDKRRAIVRLLDVSKNGMRILTPRPLDLGEILQLRLSKTLILGIVRNCKERKEGFGVGLEFINVYVIPEPELQNAADS